MQEQNETPALPIFPSVADRKISKVMELPIFVNELIRFSSG